MANIGADSYTEYDEYKYWHERFKETAFFDNLGRLVRQMKRPLNCDLAWVKITQKEYSFDWWGSFVGLIILCKLIFHRVGNIFYLYEVWPVHVSSDGEVVHGKAIRATSILFLDNAEYVCLKNY